MLKTANIEVAKREFPVEEPTSPFRAAIVPMTPLTAPMNSNAPVLAAVDANAPVNMHMTVAGVLMVARPVEGANVNEAPFRTTEALL